MKVHFGTPDRMQEIHLPPEVLKAMASVGSGTIDWRATLLAYLEEQEANPRDTTPALADWPAIIGTDDVTILIARDGGLIATAGGRSGHIRGETVADLLAGLRSLPTMPRDVP